MTRPPTAANASGHIGIRQVAARVLPYMGMFILALLLWLPFNFKTTGLIEELTITEQLDAGHPLFFVTPDSVMAISRSRPLQLFFFAAAYTLDPNSYQFYNLFMMVFFFGKMVVTYWLVLQFLPDRKLLAFVTGVLFMLYPADTGLFPLRVIHIHSAIVAYLLAVYLLIQYYKQQGRSRWLALAGAGALLIFSLGQYQIALAAAVVTPLVLLYFGRPNRRMLIAAAGWYGSMALILFYEIWAGSQPGSVAYEAVLLPSADIASSPFRSILKAVLVGYQRQFTGWLNALYKLNSLSQYGVYILAGVIISAAVGVWLLRHPSAGGDTKAVSWKRCLLLLFAGILLFPLGIATYLPLPNYRFEEFRIYLLAMFGSAVVLALLLYLASRLVPRYRESLFLVLALPFIGLGLLNALAQNQQYVNYSLEQQNILQQTLAQAPQIKPDTTVVMVDPAGALSKAYVFYYGSLLQPALRYLYSTTTLNAVYCPVYDTDSDNKKCQFEPDALHINGLADGLPYDRLLLFTTSDNGELKLLSTEDAATTFHISGYNPAARITGSTPPLRASTLFSCVPALSCIHEPAAAPLFMTGVTFDLPHSNDIGFGWRELEFNSMGETFHWSVSRTSTVDVTLPDSGDLAVTFRILYWMDEGLIDSLKLSVNGQDIALTFSPSEAQSREYQAIIPRSALTGYPAHTQLMFTVDHILPVVNDPNMQLGFALNTLRIRPA